MLSYVCTYTYLHIYIYHDDLGIFFFLFSFHLEKFYNIINFFTDIRWLTSQTTINK